MVWRQALRTQNAVPSTQHSVRPPSFPSPAPGNVHLRTSPSKKGRSGSNGNPVIDERSGKVLSDGGKSGTMLLGSDVMITNNLTISSGELKLNSWELTIAHKCEVYGTLTLDNATDVITVGENVGDWLRFHSGSAGNLSAGTANIYGWVVPEPGCSFTATTDNTIIFTGTAAGGISNREFSAVYGNIELNKEPGHTTFIDVNATLPITVNGDFTILSDNKFEMQNESMIVHGIFYDIATSEVYVHYTSKTYGARPDTTNQTGTGNDGTKGGFLTIDTDFTLNGLLDVGDGNVLVQIIKC